MSFHDGNRARRGRNPLDIRALNRDESLFTALGQGERPKSVDGDPVVDLLYRWRADLEAGASNTIEISAPDSGVRGPHSHRPVRRTSRLLTKAGRRIIVAAAALVIGLGSVGGVAAATGAGPDSTFWPVALALNTERARSVQAAKDVTGLLDAAEAEIKSGQLDQAADKLSQARQLLPVVQDVDQGRQLRQRQSDLNDQLIKARADRSNGTGQGGKSTGSGTSSGNGRQTPGAKPDPSQSQRSHRPTPSGSAPSSPTTSPTPSGSGTAGPGTANPVPS
ncbi:hypothetical protein [Fodinicola acaciae]|uniref:hypothetical protein n=1 Tax=Fodinicola acaciae TaxID=2681555 RepID=UPI0013D08737|nr:hypothetical protein [Fodinicola acaciae]